MIAAVVCLATVAAVLAGVLLAVFLTQATERREWASERRALVDRAIAQHTGEIVALDRSAAPKVSRPEQLRPIAEGL